ncbi:MAG: RelA/SpoT family protein [Candidatus Gracilibacteria bacterium]
MEKNDRQNHWKIQGKTHHFNWTARVNYFAITNRGKPLVQAKKSPAKNPRISCLLCTCKKPQIPSGFARAKNNPATIQNLHKSQEQCKMSNQVGHMSLLYPHSMIHQVISAAKTYIPNLDEKFLLEAFGFARKAHEGQTRKDGTPYIGHPVSAALILTQLHADEDTLIAAILHDVPEDTPVTLDEIEKKFGLKIRFLVDGITKLSKVHYRNDMLERQVESLKKLFIHSAHDPRIILIKLADRLHNMRTIGVVDPEKQKRIAMETMEIFVPIANLLGIWELKQQLEDCCFKVLRPKEFEELTEMVKKTAYQRQDTVKQTSNKVKKLLKTAKVPFTIVEGRQKNLYAIYTKMVKKQKSFHEIYDIVGVRIIVDNIEKCYQTLGILHQNFTPKIGRLKDYIAIPKSNGYQSIHTTVFGLKGIITEFQIRTYDMHLENEYGIAAHYFYGEEKKKESLRKKVARKYEWVQKILSMQKDISSNRQFLETLKLDIFEDRIFVFSPKGDVVDLPVGSNVIDFAYSIHSELGMLAVGAQINGKPADIFTKLKSGDTVYVETSEESDGPQAEWLSMVKTNEARHHIREFLKEQDKATILCEATSLLNHGIKNLGFEGIDVVSDYQKVMTMEDFKVDTWENLLYELGKGAIDLKDLLRVLFSKEELMGVETTPVYIKAYDRIRPNKFDYMTPEKVHQIHLIVEGRNRVGFLRDLCDELVGLGINIIAVRTMEKTSSDMERIYFSLEIVDISQYENTMYALGKVSGTAKVTRVQDHAETVA